MLGAQHPSATSEQKHDALLTHSEGMITICALILRLACVLAVWHGKPSSWFYSQASELGELAHSIQSGLGISSPFGGATGSSAFLPPGYPLLVAALFRMFGAFSHSAELVLLVMQACFGSAAVLFAMKATKYSFGSRTSRWTGLVLAIHPWLIALSFVFWETSFSLMMLCLLLWLTLRWTAHPTQTSGYTAAVLGSLAIAVNASLALTCVALFCSAAYRGEWRRERVLMPAIVFILLCSVWPARNLVAMHAFIPLRDNLGYELWQGNRPGADGFFAPELHPNTNRAEYERFVRLGELRYMQEKSTLAKDAIKAQPARFFNLSMKRIACFWLGISRKAYANQIAIASLTSLLAFFGIVTLVRRRGVLTAIPILIPLLLFPVPYYLTHPDFRFWCLLSPLLTAAAMYPMARDRREPA